MINKPEKYYAVFADYRNKKNGYISNQPPDAVPGSAALLELVDHVYYDIAVSSLNACFVSLSDTPDNEFVKGLIKQTLINLGYKKDE